MRTMLRNGLRAMGADVRRGITLLVAQARQYLTPRDALSVVLVLIGFTGLWRWPLTDTMLIQVGEWLGLGVIVRAFPLLWRFALSTQAAELWQLGQHVLTAVARVQLLRLGIGLVGPALLEVYHEMPMESSTLAVAFGFVWLVVWPKRGCQCHAD